ncbi:hypothetical protein SRHO_G00256880 [Serrasalmus rhombeus]
MDAIPIVDFGEYKLRDDEDDAVPGEQLQELREEVRSAFTEVGFVYLKNTGIEQDEVRAPRVLSAFGRVGEKSDTFHPGSQLNRAARGAEQDLHLTTSVSVIKLERKDQNLPEPNSITSYNLHPLTATGQTAVLSLQHPLSHAALQLLGPHSPDCSPISLSITVNTCSSSAGQHFIDTTWTDLNDPATLSCPEPCSGVETWERNGRKVAECGVKEESEFSCERRLTVPQVNYTTRGFYHTKCDGKVICFQNLQPRPHSSSVEVPAGDPLILDLLTFHPVNLTFSRTDGGSVAPVQMCSVDGRSVLCKVGYEDRVSLRGNSIKLRDVVPADSGVYTVREVNNGEALIRTVSVTVKHVHQSWMWKDEYQQGLKTGALGFGFGALILGVILGFFALPRGLYLMDRCVQRLRRRDSSRVDQSDDVEKSVPLT